MKQLALPDFNMSVSLLQTLAHRIPTVRPHAVDRPLVIYGAGNMGNLAAKLLDSLGIEVAYAIDQAPPSNGLLIDKIPVFLPETIPNADKKSHLLAICVVLSPYTPIYKSLVSQGWHNIVPFYDIIEAYAEVLPMGNGWFAGALNETDWGAIKKTLLKWEDDASRAAHLQFLAWRVHREEWCFDSAEVNTSDRYFPSFVRQTLKKNGESFLDAGAYIGDICQRFDSLTKGQYSELIAIEANPKNNALLRLNLSKWKATTFSNIQIFDFALSDSNEKCHFCTELGIASKIFTAGSCIVECRRLDDLHLNFSFAKFHLEGGELNAIDGSILSFQRNRPILAITVYHSRDGLYRIPQKLMDELEDYHFFLRAHAWCGTGVVLYAIPSERAKP